MQLGKLWLGGVKAVMHASQPPQQHSTTNHPITPLCTLTHTLTPSHRHTLTSPDTLTPSHPHISHPHTSSHTMHTPHRPCRHSLDELEALVRDKFSAVPNGGISAPRFPPDATTQDQADLLIRMVPEREGHSIELQVRQRGSCRCLWGVLKQGPWVDLKRKCLYLDGWAGGLGP